MASIRLERLNSEMQRNISSILQGGLRDVELTAMVSVMSVEITNDLKHAKVALSIYGNADEKKKNFEAVCHSKWFIRKELAMRMSHMRVMPELHFHIDESLDYSDHINQLLRDLNKG